MPWKNILNKKNQLPVISKQLSTTNNRRDVACNVFLHDMSRPFRVQLKVINYE